MNEQYDFDRIIDCSDTSSIKWDKYKGRDILPMWIADTDFAVLPEIQQALKRRADHPVFGYTDPPPRLTPLLVERLQRNYRWQVDPKWLVYLPGLIGAFFLACRATGRQGDPVLLPGIIYPPFSKAPGLCKQVNRPIPMCRRDARMVIDLDWLEQQETSPGQLLLFCNPQNPGGAVYREDELRRLADFVERRDLVLVSDEIHCELILEPGLRHVPIASLNPSIERRSVTLMAPSKTFNLAGMGFAFAIVPDPALRREMRTNPFILPNVNLMGYAAAEAAYRCGDEWNRQQCAYLRSNRDFLVEEINRIDGLRIDPIEATYLAWIDVSALQLEDPPGFFESAGLGLSPGSDFGDADFMRLNFACPRSRVEEAVKRFRAAVDGLG